MKVIKYITIWTIILGVIAVAINSVWPNSIVYITDKTIHPMQDSFVVHIKTFNFQAYLQNLEFAAAKTTYLALQMPTKEWKDDAWEIITWLEQIANNLGVILNYGILAINIMIYPFRIISYMIQLLMAFIGFNMSNLTGNAFSWLKDLTEWFIERLQIPYIQ